MQITLATAKLLWNNFIVHYGFPTKMISDQGSNFESELIANLCQVAGVQKLGKEQELLKDRLFHGCQKSIRDSVKYRHVDSSVEYMTFLEE